eukprot:gene5172-8778_t
MLSKTKTNGTHLEKEKPEIKIETERKREEEKRTEKKNEKRKQEDERKSERKSEKKREEERKRKKENIEGCSEKKKKEILIISSLTKEVVSLLRSIFMMKKDVFEIEEPYIFDYNSVEYWIHTVDGKDSVTKRQNLMKQFLFKENGIIYFLFSYTDFNSLENIMKIYFKEVDQLSKEEEFHKKLNFMLLVHVDLNKITKTLIKMARSQLEEFPSFKDRTCIEYNSKLHLNIKTIFDQLEFYEENGSNLLENQQNQLKIKKSVFPKLFSKKKSNINFIYISDNFLKKKGDIKKEESTKKSNHDLIGSDKKENELQIDDPTENDLITTFTAGLTDLTDDVTSEYDHEDDHDLDTMRSDIKGIDDDYSIARSPENSELA